MSKVSLKPSNTLPEHQNWNEISTLIRLALVVGSQSTHSGQNYLYVPEIIHLVSLVAGDGPSLVRKSVYGIIMNLLQSLYISRPDDRAETELVQLINDCTLPENLQLFGLRRETLTAEYSNTELSGERASLDTQEKMTQLLLRIMTVTAGSTGMFYLIDFATICHIFPRFAECLESSMDEFGYCNGVPAIPGSSNSVICCSGDVSRLPGGR